MKHCRPCLVNCKIVLHPGSAAYASATEHSEGNWKEHITYCELRPREKRIHLQKLTDPHLVKTFPKFYETQRFNTISDVNPHKHNIRTLYIHLFTLLQHISVILFDHHQAENTNTQLEKCAMERNYSIPCKCCSQSVSSACKCCLQSASSSCICCSVSLICN
jgi:hypothetical protein